MEKFYEKIKNSVYACLPRAEYAEIVNRLTVLNQDKSIKKEKKDYRLLLRYELQQLNIEGMLVQRLLLKGTDKRFVCKEVFN